MLGFGTPAEVLRPDLLKKAYGVLMHFVQTPDGEPAPRRGTDGGMEAL
jgi:hypothetical protein